LHFAPRTKIENESTLQLHLFVDNSSIEVFADGGATIITDIFFPSKPFDSVRLFSSDGKAQVTAGQYYTLKNAGIHQ
jgi:sucrose-6-phosphate hydrolase SacC (GH32 family)